ARAGPSSGRSGRVRRVNGFSKGGESFYMKGLFDAKRARLSPKRLKSPPAAPRDGAVHIVRLGRMPETRDALRAVMPKPSAGAFGRLPALRMLEAVALRIRKTDIRPGRP